jgi:hypothetical protein
VIQLTITYDPHSNQIGVNGPIEQKTLCYGLLESAKDAIRDHCAKQSGGIVLAGPEMPGMPKMPNGI